MASPKVVLVNGCFDPFHYGHLLHFEAAKKMGTWLVVSVTIDSEVNKPNRPIFSHKQRAKVIKALRCVDQVITVRGPLQAFRKVKPDIFVKGIEYFGKIKPYHRAYCDKHGIEIRFTNKKVYSSTKILDELRRG